LVASALALVLATALAWSVMSAKSAPPTLVRQESPPYWPFSFSLPEEFVRQGSSTPFEPSGGFAHDSGVALYTMGPRRRASVLMQVSFRLLPMAASVDQLAKDFEVDGFERQKPLAIGELTGHMIEVVDMRRETVHFIALAQAPSGLALLFDYETGSGGKKQRRTFEAICGSVAFRDWFTPLRKEADLDDIVS